MFYAGIVRNTKIFSQNFWKSKNVFPDFTAIIIIRIIRIPQQTFRSIPDRFPSTMSYTFTSDTEREHSSACIFELDVDCAASDKLSGQNTQ